MIRSILQIDTDTYMGKMLLQKEMIVLEILMMLLSKKWCEIAMREQTYKVPARVAE